MKYSLKAYQRVVLAASASAMNAGNPREQGGRQQTYPVAVVAGTESRPTGSKGRKQRRLRY
jgi:hypothetical protein